MMCSRLTNLAVLDHSPLESLHVDTYSEQCREENHSLQTHLLALIMLRLGSPV